MPSINILSPHVADMIAAGEVVERPASVIKELLENAFDAGAKNVTVEIRGGGAPYIRVTDDGCGMAPEDAGIAFLRHATSKLSDERGLEAIRTMGFRGEALAAISAVSHIELLTRQKGAGSGTRMTLAAGVAALEDKLSADQAVPVVPVDAKPPASGALRAALAADDMQRRLKEIYRLAKTDLEESGVNALYLALGFLKWRPKGANVKDYRAPILLMPVQLIIFFYS